MNYHQELLAVRTVGREGAETERRLAHMAAARARAARRASRRCYARP